MNSHKGGPQPSSATHRVRPPGELTPGDSESGCKSEVSVKGRASAVPDHLCSESGRRKGWVHAWDPTQG